MISRRRLEDEMARTDQLRPPGEGTDVRISISELYVTCLAAGSIRGNYREATYFVRFTGAPAQPNAVLTGTVDVICFERNNPRFWELNARVPFNFVSNETDVALLSTNDTTQRDCQRCNAPNHEVFPLNSENDDQLRHCKRCPDACLQENLTLCYGRTDNQCCNVYIEENNNVFRCAVQCPTNYSATEATEYVCRCDLGCRRGGRNNDRCDMCICPQGTTGAFCETLLDACNPNPCLNGGTCTSNYPNYTCTCPPGFTGTNCSVELDPCQDMPCENGGTCERGTYPNFTCTCPPDFTGMTCGTEICGNFVCLNGGVCEVVNGRPVCRCSTSHFVGPQCENCTIPNCRNCSIDRSGQCLKCEPGFALSNGSCILDCSQCDSIVDDNQRGICHFFCELRQWREESIKCDVNSPNAMFPSTSLDITEQYSQAVIAARGAETAWSNGVSLMSVVTPMRSNNTLATWRAATIQWVGNLRIWLSHIRSVDNTFPNFNLDNLLDGINDDSRAQDVHMRIRNVWLQMFNEFNTKRRCE